MSVLVATSVHAENRSTILSSQTPMQQSRRIKLVEVTLTLSFKRIEALHAHEH